MAYKDGVERSQKKLTWAFVGGGIAILAVLFFLGTFDSLLHPKSVKPAPTIVAVEPTPTPSAKPSPTPSATPTKAAHRKHK